MYRCRASRSHAPHLHYLYTHGNRHRRAFLHSRRPYLRAIGESPACHAEFLGRKAREVEDFNWASVGLDVVTAKTKYPEPKRKPPRCLLQLGNSTGQSADSSAYCHSWDNPSADPHELGCKHIAGISFVVPFFSIKSRNFTGALLFAASCLVGVAGTVNTAELSTR